jgi:multiple antibiotic resistance protein
MSLWKYGVEALVADETKKRGNQLVLQASLVAFFVISLFALFGQFILRYLNISLPAMQGAGGLLLLLVSLELLTGKDSTSSASSGVNIALVPLGTPLLAGPGAIVATLVNSSLKHGCHESAQRIWGKPGRANCRPLA